MSHVRYRNRPLGDVTIATMSKFIIRAATSADVPTIRHLIQGLAEYEKMSDQMVATEAQFQEHLFGPKPIAEAILALEDDHPVGFALFFPNFSTFLGKPGLHLEDLYVVPEARSKGYGKALLTYLAKLAVDRNCGRFEWTVLDWNEPAIKFYESMGARIQREWLINRVDGDALQQMAAMSKFS